MIQRSWFANCFVSRTEAHRRQAAELLAAEKAAEEKRGKGTVRTEVLRDQNVAKPVPRAATPEPVARAKTPPPPIAQNLRASSNDKSEKPKASPPIPTKAKTKAPVVAAKQNSAAVSVSSLAHLD